MQINPKENSIIFVNFGLSSQLRVFSTMIGPTPSLSISTWLSLRSRRHIYCHGNIGKRYEVLGGHCSAVSSELLVPLSDEQSTVVTVISS